AAAAARRAAGRGGQCRGGGARARALAHHAGGRSRRGARVLRGAAARARRLRARTRPLHERARRAGSGAMSGSAGPTHAGAVAHAPPAGAALLEAARRVIRQEAEAVAALEPRIDDRFLAAVERIGAAGGRVVVSGIGKSGIIARK